MSNKDLLKQAIAEAKTIREAAIANAKEALEETGIEGIYPVSQEIFDIDVHLFPESHVPAHWHYDIRFLLQAPADSVIVSNHESLEVIWATPEHVEQKTQQRSVIRMVEKWQKHKVQNYKENYCLQKY